MRTAFTHQKIATQIEKGGKLSICFFPPTQTVHTSHSHHFAKCYHMLLAGKDTKPFVGMVKPASIIQNLITIKPDPQTLKMGFSMTTLHHLNEAI